MFPGRRRREHDAVCGANLKEVGQDNQCRYAGSAGRWPAHADGIHSTSDEVASIEKNLLRLWDWIPRLSYSDLHAGEVARWSAHKFVLAPGRPGESDIPTEKASGAETRRFADRAIRSDTERVSSSRSRFLRHEEEGNGVSGPCQPQAMLRGLTQNQRRRPILRTGYSGAFGLDNGVRDDLPLEWLRCGPGYTWKREWMGFRRTYDEALLDEYDGYDLSPEIARGVKGKMGAEGRNT